MANRPSAHDLLQSILAALSELQTQEAARQRHASSWTLSDEELDVLVAVDEQLHELVGDGETM